MDDPEEDALMQRLRACFDTLVAYADEREDHVLAAKLEDARFRFASQASV